MAQLILGALPDSNTRPTLRSTVSRVWAVQAEWLYGTVAGALRTMLDVLLSAAMPWCLCQVLGWVGALSVAHPEFVPYTLKSVRWLCWDDAPDVRPSPSTPSSSQGASPSKLGGSQPLPLVPMLVECLRLTSRPSPGKSPESRGIEAADQHALQQSVVRVCHTVAWTQAPYGLQEYV